LGISIYKTSLLHRPDDYIGFTPGCPPHILQQNCAHDQDRRIRSHFLILTTVKQFSKCRYNLCKEWMSVRADIINGYVLT